MKQYLLSVHMDEDAPTPSDEEIQGAYEAVDAFNADIQASGNWVFAGGLHPSDRATVVDATGDSVLTTDGPYAESKEQLGGFWVVTAEDLDAALALARRASRACLAPVEVRPFQDEPEDDEAA